MWVVHIRDIVIFQRTEFAESLLFCFDHTESFQFRDVVTHRLGRCSDLFRYLGLCYVGADIEKIDDPFLGPVQCVGMGVFSKWEAGILGIELFHRALPDRTKKSLPLQHIEMVGTLSITYRYGLFYFCKGRSRMVVYVLEDASSDVLLLDVLLDIFFRQSGVERNDER